jgi:hypothetical protein
MAWDSAGNLYITDGYINSRVAVYDKNGVWVRSFGEQGKGPGQFINLHNIAIDSQDRIYIADRANARIPGVRQEFHVPPRMEAAHRDSVPHHAELVG